MPLSIRNSNSISLLTALLFSFLLCHPSAATAHQTTHQHDAHHTHDQVPHPPSSLTSLLTSYVTHPLHRLLTPLQTLPIKTAAFTASLLTSSVSLISLLLLPFPSLATILLPFSAGALLSDLFNHLLPSIFANPHPHSINALFSAIFLFALLDAILRRHSHDHNNPNNPHSNPHTPAYINLAADALHNFCDGLSLAAAFLASPTAGIATTIAIILHELPQELADFAVLLCAGFSRTQALLANLLCATTALLGTYVGFAAAQFFSHANALILPFAAGGLLYMTFASVLPPVVAHIASPDVEFRDAVKMECPVSFFAFLGKACRALISAAAGVFVVALAESLHAH